MRPKEENTFPISGEFIERPERMLLIATFCFYIVTYYVPPVSALPVHWASSLQSPQSFSPSHFHHVGMQRPFLHSYWKYLEQPGTSVGAAAGSTISSGKCLLHPSGVTRCWFLRCLVRKIFLTTVGLVRVVAAVVHAVALPLQAHAHSIGALKGVGVAHFAEFRRCGCRRRKNKASIEVFIEIKFKYNFCRLRVSRGGEGSIDELQELPLISRSYEFFSQIAPHYLVFLTTSCVLGVLV